MFHNKIRSALSLAAILATCWTASSAPAAVAKKSPARSRFLAGVPFAPSARPSLFKNNGSTTLPVNAKVQRLYFLGMTNSLDQGSPGWGKPFGERDCRFFLGSTIGTVSLVKTDGTSVSLPLTFGYNVWWWAAFSRDGYRAPFDTTAGDQLLTRSLQLRDLGRKPPEAFMMTVDAGNADLREIVLSDSPSLLGFPVVSAVTAGTDATTSALGLTLRGAVSLPPVKNAASRTRAIELSAAAKVSSSSVAALRNVLYSSADKLAAIKHFPMDVPPNYTGPKVLFRGPVEADMITNQYMHNLMDIMAKSEGGRYRTSTPGAPNWGRYKGFGTWKDGVGWNENRAWSRDFGPALIELAELGYQSRAEGLCEYAWKWARWFRDVDMRYSDGTPVPPHWIRAIDTPEERSHNPVREGVQENDGHGLLMLATYKTWQRAKDPKAWARDHWQDYSDAAEWICWQFEHPALSGATTVMRTVSECSRKPEKSPYAEFPCAMGLLSHAEIAESIGETTSAARWRDRAAKMLAAMPGAYIVDDPFYGRRWDNAFAWGGHYPALGPLIDQADFNGLRPAKAMPQWLDVNKDTYLWQLHEHKGQPIDYHAGAIGYGQAFTAESALLLDRMDEATSLVDTMCRLSWFPGFKPWIVPEGVEWTNDRKFWFRICDLGNGVQQANFMKTCRLIIGVDDSKPGKLEILPRLPNGWTTMEISDYPALTSRGEARLKFNYERPSPGNESFKLTSDLELQPMTIRIGPFPKNTTLARLQITVDQSTGTIKLAREGTSSWAYLHTTLPTAAVSFHAQLKN